MFRFSCFSTQMYSHKQKKTVQISTEAMQKTLEECLKDEATRTNFNRSPESSFLYPKIEGDDVEHSANWMEDSNIVCNSKSEEMECKYTIDSELPVKKDVQIKRSRSLGNFLDMKGRDSSGNDFVDEKDQQFSCDGSHGHSGSLAANGAKEYADSLQDRFQEALSSDAFQVNSDMVNHGSTCSIGDAKLSEREGHEKADVQLSGGGESADYTQRTLPVLIKSNSLPIIGSPVCIAYPLPHSRSAEDLCVLDSRQKEVLAREVKTLVMSQEKGNGEVWNSNGKNNCENPVEDNCDSYNYVASAKDWIMPVGVEVDRHHDFPRYSSIGQCDGLPNTDFKIKRIQEWVIDLQHCCPLEDSDEFFSPKADDVANCRTVLDNLPDTRMADKASSTMEAVKKYISSLSANAMTAQLVNHGLVVIPFLSAFSSLRALNLSGNAIARITAGALPRGLHYLNLSKNNISTIEGLRELTRLRVLDLSYNRILRIGHGLASCSSLKELYLAGNKISEVEGLHRLLKLSVLDLRFNKISTTKCLGQLAANYMSLQAISLEGNPAQKNVGDEQLKKYLQGLLPHLTYFNRQSMKVGTSKDTTDRSARLGIAPHQIDRGHKADLKAMRKGSHNVSGKKLGSSSVHSRRGHASTSSKPQTKTKHVRLPPSGTKLTTQPTHMQDFSSKLLNFRSELSMRRSRSEGNLDGF